MASRIYCTYCDHRYLPRALALVESMARFQFDGEVWIFCLSEECHEILAKFAAPGFRVIQLQQLEACYPDLLALKTSRQTIEYYYTCTPAILHYAFAHRPDAQWVTFLDADLWFFASPDKVFEEIGQASVVIIPHNFHPRKKSLEKHGIYNVGWVSFFRNEEGQRCLEWWRSSCIEWCYGRIEGDKYADQRYLDRFPEIAPHTKILRHKGCNLAPWNIRNYSIALKNDRVYVDEDPLYFFHFSGIKESFHTFYFDNHRLYGAQHSRVIRNNIYKPYIECVIGREEKLKGFVKGGEGIVLPRGAKFAGIDFKNAARWILRTYQNAIDLIQGWPIVVWRGRVL